MGIDLNINVLVGDEQVTKVVLNGVTVWQRVTTTEPVIESFTGTKTAETDVTLNYVIDNGGSPLTNLDYRINGGAWTDAPSLALSGSIDITGMEIGEVVHFELLAVNEVGETISETVSFLISGEFVAFSEDFSGAGKLTDDAWRDDNNGDPIAGLPVNVTVREGGGFDGKMVQIKYLAWDLGQGNYPGTRRLEHPFAYFNVPMEKAYEYSIDWYFEGIWDWNTIGQDAATLKQRLMDYDGLSEAAADAQVASWNPNPLYADTGFPYQAGKMHGFITEVEGAAPAGSNPKAPDEWSVRCSWVKNAQSHPTTDGSGVFTDGADPNIGPTLALYIYDQDREPDEEGDWPSGRYVFVDDFGGLEKETWYRIKLFVQVNDKGKRNGIAHLKVYDRATDTLIASAFVDNLLLHDATTIGEAYIRQFMFSTFFGGGDMRFSPKLDPAWDSEVDINSGVYARNDNYTVNRIPALAPPIVSQTYNAGDTDVEVTHPLGVSLFDDLEYNVTANGTDYDPNNWTAPTSYTVTSEVASFTIATVNDGDEVRVRVVNGERRSARSDVSVVVVPTVPDAPSVTETVNGDGEFTVFFIPPFSNGGSDITKYQYRVDGGAAQETAAFPTYLFTSDSFTVTGSNGVTYAVEVRAVNGVGEGPWSAPTTATPKADLAIPTTNLIRAVDPNELSLNDGDEVTSLPDLSDYNQVFTERGSGGPAYIENVINGNSVIRFDGGPEYLESDNPDITGVSNEGSIYLVSKSVESDSNLVVNSDFAVNTDGWTPIGDTVIEPSSGELKIISTSESRGAEQTIRGLTVGHTYLLRWETLSTSGGRMYVGDDEDWARYSTVSYDNPSIRSMYITPVNDHIKITPSFRLIGDTARYNYITLQKSLVKNGFFEKGTTNWSAYGDSAITTVGWALEIVSTSYYRGAHQTISGLIPGYTYEVEFELTSSRGRMYIGDNADDNRYKSTSYSGAGIYREVITPINDNIRLTPSVHSIGDTATFKYVSLKNIPQGSPVFAHPLNTANTFNIHLPFTDDGGTDLIAFDWGDRANNGRLLFNGVGQLTFGSFNLWEFRVNSNEMSVYKDGELVQPQSVSSSLDVTDLALRLSGYQGGGFNGDIAFLAIYDRYIANESQDRLTILNYIASRFGLSITTPSAPTVNSVSVTPGDSRFTVNWDVNENGSTLTEIRLEVDGVLETLQDNGSPIIDPVNSFTKTGLTNGQVYDVRMRFINSIGAVFSTLVQVTPQPVANEEFFTSTEEFFTSNYEWF